LSNALSNTLLLITVLVPLAVGFVLLFLPNKLKAVFQKLALVIAALTFVLSIWIFAGRPQDYSLTVLQLGDCLLIAIYSLKAVGDTGSSNLYFGSLLMTIGGSAGILLSGHLLFLLIFWEIVTASLYLLITTGGRKTNFAATKTFAMIGASDAAFMLGVFMVWTLAGNHLIMSQISLPTAGAMPIIAFLLLMTAAITKAGAMPLHTWLPTSGEVAPTPVMALLPAAIDKLLGIYLLVIIVRELFVLESPALGVLLAIMQLRLLLP